MRIVYCWLAFIQLLFISCSDKNKIFIVIDRADGIQKGAVVKDLGVQVGEVSNLFLQDSAVLLELVLKKNYQIPKGSRFDVFIDNILDGSYFIRIERSKSGEYFGVGDTVPLFKNRAFLSDSISAVTLDSISKEQLLKGFEKLDRVLEVFK